MIVVSTKLNAHDLRIFKKSQKTLFFCSGVCASFGIIGGSLLSIFLHNPIFLILMIGSVIIVSTSVYFNYSLRKNFDKRRDGSYSVITFESGDIRVERRDDGLLTPAKTLVFHVSDCIVTRSASGEEFTIKNAACAENPTVFLTFNHEGFIKGTRSDLIEYLQSYS
ncbi:MAG: hypothetical protein LBQ27_02850 [Clostridiales bacterium]|nr:hypothetical protein [Clostridiales bacterium]